MLIDREGLERWVSLQSEHAARHLQPQPGVSTRCQMLTDGRPELTWFICFEDGLFSSSGLGPLGQPDCTLRLALSALEQLISDPDFDYLAAYVDGTMTFMAGSPEGAAGLSAVVNGDGWRDLMAALHEAAFGNQ